jgi:hypothetical protein
MVNAVKVVISALFHHFHFLGLCYCSTPLLAVSLSERTARIRDKRKRLAKGGAEIEQQN